MFICTHEGDYINAVHVRRIEQIPGSPRLYILKDAKGEEIDKVLQGDIDNIICPIIPAPPGTEAALVAVDTPSDGSAPTIDDVIVERQHVIAFRLESNEWAVPLLSCGFRIANTEWGLLQPLVAVKQPDDSFTDSEGACYADADTLRAAYLEVARREWEVQRSKE